MYIRKKYFIYNFKRFVNNNDCSNCSSYYYFMLQ
ncbi:protein of unknown function [Xenorhabdus poinarii G6]|uniref:FERM domain-containing protein n=1 Tax=Xenorhabdus poinarii G6 TaxID=1354304 RepID=A0A068R3T7_9GAMM|nr:protein of unknown function [Xenorhabdus poinarii G6]